ncbi:uncharacterized protein LOC141651916 [Silene latifolia]|uniref:uncharacterized protein LOC141651916 n=1 Tax=Silene latifolia TaxID=37657 RepID=UPI003D76F0AF
MKYLSRVLMIVQDFEGFRYHPLRKALKLSHLYFANDLLLFCKDDKKSVVMLLRAFKTFSRASGLCMNKAKSCIYGNGVTREAFVEMIQLDDIQEGKLPFKYLGIPIIAKRISASECSKLAQIFILPANILKKVEALCRSFLWQGKEIANGPPLISWDTCCMPKKAGGLGIIEHSRWNVAALGKYIWWIAKKEDHLWVKWIHAVYVKNEDWVTYQPTAGASWAWRKLCGVKEKLKAGYYGDWWLQQDHKYIIKASSKCLKLLNTWLKVAIPTSGFIRWWVDRKMKSLLHKKTGTEVGQARKTPLMCERGDWSQIRADMSRNRWGEM